MPHVQCWYEGVSVVSGVGSAVHPVEPKYGSRRLRSCREHLALILVFSQNDLRITEILPATEYVQKTSS